MVYIILALTRKILKTQIKFAKVYVFQKNKCAGRDPYDNFDAGLALHLLLNLLHIILPRHRTCRNQSRKQRPTHSCRHNVLARQVEPLNGSSWL